MADSRHPGKFLADLSGTGLLELLHREADGDLTPAEWQWLKAQQDNADVQAARTALRRAVSLLSGPNPHPPRPVAGSVAAGVVADIALSRALASPPLPRSVATNVAAEVALSRQLQPLPAQPASVAARVAGDIQATRQLQPPPPPRSVAADVTRRMAAPLPLPAQPPQSQPTQSRLIQAPPTQPGPHNPAPLLLVGALLAGVTLLGLTTAWPNLAAGATVLRALLAQVSPLAGLGLALLLLTSVLITWKPTPTLRTAGAAAFALSAALTLPALYNVAGDGLSVGRNITVSGPVTGNIIAIGGNVDLKPSARVGGEVVTLLGDVRREPGAQVGGRVSALLGQVPGDRQAIQTQPVSDLSLATAAAFRPVLGWLGSAAWPQIFVALTGGLLLLLFVVGLAPRLARRQRHAPMRALALGVLLLAALLLPVLALALSGFLAPALVACALAVFLIAAGLSVSVYDAGRALAYRLRLPVPDAVGALLGLSALAASQSYAPLALMLALIGGAWGAGTLLLSRREA